MGGGERKSFQARVGGSQCAGRGAGAAPGPAGRSGRRSGGYFFRPAGGFFPWRPGPIAPPRAIGLPRGCAARAPRGARGVCGRAPRKRGENAVLGAVALPIVFGFRDGRCIGRNPTRVFHVPQNLALLGTPRALRGRPEPCCCFLAGLEAAHFSHQVSRGGGSSSTTAKAASRFDSHHRSCAERAVPFLRP